LPTQDVDDVPAQVNTYCAEGTNSDNDVTTCLQAYNDWNNAVTSGVSETNTAVGMLGTLMGADGITTQQDTVI
jgi:hypothetical protein